MRSYRIFFGRNRHRHNRQAVPRLLALALLLATALLPAQEDPTFRVDVKLVSLFVNVTDGHGALVGGLGRENFAVTEDGRPQQIAVFERQSAQPLNIVLAIDTSGSVRKDMSQETAAARRFVRSLLRPQDQMSVFEFSTDVRELAGFTNKPAEIDRALGKLRGDYATALYDMIRLGAERLGNRQGRKVLVLVSDGGDTAQSSTYAQALEAALHNEAMIYSLIDVPIAASAGRRCCGRPRRRTRADHPLRANRRRALLRRRGRARPGLRRSQRGSAQPISAGLLSAPSGAGPGLSSP